MNDSSPTPPSPSDIREALVAVGVAGAPAVAVMWGGEAAAVTAPCECVVEGAVSGGREDEGASASPGGCAPVRGGRVGASANGVAAEALLAVTAVAARVCVASLPRAASVQLLTCALILLGWWNASSHGSQKSVAHC